MVFLESLADLQESNILNKTVSHLTTLQNWLKPVIQSINSQWRHCWLASVDGWSAYTFHSYCDNKEPTVAIIRMHHGVSRRFLSIYVALITSATMQIATHQLIVYSCFDKVLQKNCCVTWKVRVYANLV